MKSPLRTLDFYCIIIGALLLVQGIYNLLDPPFLGVFTSNPLHAVIHVLLGITGIWTGLRGGAQVYALFLGILLLTLGISYFVAPLNEVLVNLFNVNAPVAWLNIIIGGVSLLVVVLGKKLASRFSVQ
ncbi:protein of unknown function [Salinimicrobium catena]|uniref:DUF4383 domain-containing protein n=1 Tax=Salinimicrobium catena TaxID=390640 RepID=A0A1H5MZ44_9FLAO|nr:DUF4383 domain-containing protein [Salinimicrobium catena]SDL31291.1 protein of unknown function [Salinimicrobium catena]SEE93668.1 protein of unknown function [Salinimicrobium catena]